jgi:hypothetical protein
MRKEDTMTKELEEARARLEDAIDCSGAAREDDEIVVVTAGDIRRLLDALSYTGGGGGDGECTCPQCGRWCAAEDIDAMVRKLDVAMNGDDAATNPKLCDIFGQLVDRVSASTVEG